MLCLMAGIRSAWMGIREGWCDDAGQDLLEYAILVALIVIVAVGAVGFLGNQVNTVLWMTIANNF